MPADNFFHPNHMIPASEFAPALVKSADSLETEMGMKIRAVCREIFVIFIGVSNAGIEV